MAQQKYIKRLINENCWNPMIKMEKEKKINEYFTSLSNTKKGVNFEEIKRELDKKMNQAELRYKEYRNSLQNIKQNTTTSRIKRYYKKMELNISNELEEKYRRTKYKLDKADLLLEKIKECQTHAIQISKERRQKKILRSKVKEVFMNEFGRRCARHEKSLVRHIVASKREEIMNKKCAEDFLTEIKSQADIDRHLPDEILVKNFNLKELRYVYLFDMN